MHLNLSQLQPRTTENHPFELDPTEVGQPEAVHTEGPSWPFTKATALTFFSPGWSHHDL